MNVFAPIKPRSITGILRTQVLFDLKEYFLFVDGIAMNFLGENLNLATCYWEWFLFCLVFDWYPEELKKCSGPFCQNAIQRIKNMNVKFEKKDPPE